MAKGKRYEDAAKRFDREQFYPPNEAVGLAKDLSSAKFDETIELAVRLGVDPRKADQIVRGTVALPAGTGKDVRVAVFAAGEAAAEARAAGADLVGADDLAAEIEKGMLDFDVAIATPDLMPMVGKLGRVLGPRGLMPNPKTGTVTNNVGQAVTEFKGGKVEYRTDRHGNVHVPLGKASFPIESLLTNYGAVLDELQRAKPASAKGKYLKHIAVSSTMGPGVKIDAAHAATRGRQGRFLSEKAERKLEDDELAAVAPPPFWNRFGLRGPVIVLAWIGRNAKRMFVAALGFTVLGAGVAMLALPGPGVIVIIVGLAILATEFAWAERALDKTMGRASQAAGAVTGNLAGRGDARPQRVCPHRRRRRRVPR